MDVIGLVGAAIAHQFFYPGIPRGTPLDSDYLLISDLNGCLLTTLAAPATAVTAGFAPYDPVILARANPELLQGCVQKRLADWKRSFVSPARRARRRGSRLTIRERKVLHQLDEIDRYSPLRIGATEDLAKLRKALATNVNGNERNEENLETFPHLVLCEFVRMIRDSYGRPFSMESLVVNEDLTIGLNAPKPTKKGAKKKTGFRRELAELLGQGGRCKEKLFGAQKGTLCTTMTPEEEAAHLELFRQLSDLRDCAAEFPLLGDLLEASKASDLEGLLGLVTYVRHLIGTLSRVRNPALRGAIVYSVVPRRIGSREKVAAAYGTTVDRMRGQEEAARQILQQLSAA